MSPLPAFSHLFSLGTTFKPCCLTKPWVLNLALLGLLACSKSENDSLGPTVKPQIKPQVNLDSLLPPTRDSVALLRLLDSNKVPPENFKKICTWVGNRITELNISNLEFNYLTKEILYLDSLRYLNAQKCNLVRIPDSISKLQNLQVLLLGQNKLDSVVAGIQKLQNLEVLDLSQNRIKRIPNQLPLLPKLKHLRLSSNPLTQLDSVSWNSGTLKVLGLENAGLGPVLPDFHLLTALDTLILTGNAIKYLPKGFLQLPLMRTLHLDKNMLDSIPESISELKSLQYLSVVDNNIRSVNAGINKLDSLKILNLSDNQLTQWPTIGPFTSLRQLLISNNFFEFLPSLIGSNKNLEELLANNNRIIQLPYTVSDMSKLKILNIKDNNIITIPPSITGMPTLQNLFVDGNPSFCFTDSSTLPRLRSVLDVPAKACDDLSKYTRPYNTPSLVKGVLELGTRDNVTFTYKYAPLPNSPIYIHKSNDSLYQAQPIYTDARGQFSISLPFGTYFLSYYHYYSDTLYPTSACSQKFSLVNLNDTLSLKDIYLGSTGMGCANKIKYPAMAFKVKRPGKKDTTEQVLHVKTKKPTEYWPDYVFNHVIYSSCPPPKPYIDSSKFLNLEFYFFGGNKKPFLLDGKIDTTFSFITKVHGLNPEVSCNIPSVPLSNKLDDDGDGCYDEEIWDGLDNDGDGLIDEDVREGSYTGVTLQNLLDPVITGGDALTHEGGKITNFAATNFWVSGGEKIETRATIAQLKIMPRTKDSLILEPAINSIGGCWGLYRTVFK